MSRTKGARAPRTEPDRKTRDHAERQRDPERDHAQRAQDDDPAADAADRPAEVRRGRCDQRARERDAGGGVDGRRSRRGEPVHQRRNAIGHERRQAGRQDRCDELIAEQEQPSRRHEGGDEQGDGPQDQQIGGDLPEPPEEPGEVLDELGEPLVGRRRVRRRDRDQPERQRGEEEQDQVRRPACPRRIRARREEADAEVGLVPSDPRPGPRAMSAGRFGRLGLFGRLRGCESLGRCLVVRRLHRPHPSERSKAAGSRSSGSASGPRSFDERWS